MKKQPYIQSRKNMEGHTKIRLDRFSRRPRFGSLYTLAILPLLAVAGVGGGRADYRHVRDTDDDDDSNEGPVDPSKSHRASKNATSLFALAARADVGEFVREDRITDKV
jgi:hypothetical protein